MFCFKKRTSTQIVQRNGGNTPTTTAHLYSIRTDRRTGRHSFEILDARQNRELRQRQPPLIQRAVRLLSITGSGILVHSRIAPFVIDVEAVSSRLIQVCIAAQKNITLVSAYAPQATLDVSHNEAFYKHLGAIKRRAKGQVVIAGDFNARLHGRQDHELQHVGQGIFGKGEAAINFMTKETWENRQFFMDFVLQHELFVANTKFVHSGHPELLVTYREKEQKVRPPLAR